MYNGCSLDFGLELGAVDKQGHSMEKWSASANVPAGPDSGNLQADRYSSHYD